MTTIILQLPSPATHLLMPLMNPSGHDRGDCLCGCLHAFNVEVDNSLVKFQVVS